MKQLRTLTKHSNHKGFTLIEVLVVLAILSIVILSLTRFYTGMNERISASEGTTISFMTEYRDALAIRTATTNSELSYIENADNLTLVESGTDFNLYHYNGEYIDIYKVIRSEG